MLILNTIVISISWIITLNILLRYKIKSSDLKDLILNGSEAKTSVEKFSMVIDMVVELLYLCIVFLCWLIFSYGFVLCMVQIR